MEPSDILAERAPQSFKDQVPRFPALKVGSSFQTHPGGSDPSSRIKEMETDGLSAEVLYPTYLLPHFAMDDGKLQAVSFRAYNDWLIEYCQDSAEALARHRRDLGLRYRRSGQRARTLRPKPG